jgi:hypothetical protein
MNIVVKSALASAALAFGYACATPVEIDDVQEVDPDAFGDAGLLGGAGGGAGQSGASQGGTGAGLGGTASGSGGAGGAGIGGMPVGLSGSGGLPVAGAGGSGVGGASGGGSGGAAGSAAGAGGAAGTAGTAGTAGAAGTAGSGSSAVFDPASCDFDDTTGCDTLTCQARCPTNDGGSCSNRCVAVVDCVSEDVASNPDAPCLTEDDPLCGGRDGGQPRACTTVVEPAGGPNPSAPTGTQAPQPSFVARSFVECICSLPRP